MAQGSSKKGGATRRPAKKSTNRKTASAATAVSRSRISKKNTPPPDGKKRSAAYFNTLKISKATQRRLVFFSSVAVVAVAGFFVFRAVSVSADVAVFHPSTCLGGWTNPFKAADTPQVSDDNTAVLSRDNSAVLPTNTHADIFCGGFKGSIPEGSEAKKIILTMSWDTAKDDGAAPAAVTGENFEAKAGTLLDSSSSDSVSFTLTASSTDTSSDAASAAAAPSVQPPADDKSATDAPAITSFLNLFASPVYAEDIASDTVPAVLGAETSSTDAVIIPDTGTTITSGSEVIAPDSASQADVQATSSGKIDNVASPAASSAATTSDAITSVPAPDAIQDTSSANDFLEVFYTLDGIHWESLGRVDAEHLRYSIFEIPVPPDTKWSDMSDIQIAVKSLDSIDNTPAVYLDGMTLQVTYGKADSKPFVSKSGLYFTMAHSYSPNFTFKQRNNGDIQEVVVNGTPPIGGVAIFDKNTSLLVENAYVAGDEFVLQPESFGKGDYIFVRTSDPDNCSYTPFDVCRAGALGDEGRFIVGDGESSVSTSTDAVATSSDATAADASTTTVEESASSTADVSI